MIEWVLIALASVWAGLINSVVGSGTLVTFSTLVWLGVPPLTANVSNNIGLVPGALTAYFGTRSSVVHGQTLLRRLVPLSVAGGLIGATLLILLPERVFQGVVPVFIFLGVALVAFGPRISKLRGNKSAPFLLLAAAVMIAGVYGGYFGAAQGIILIGLLHGLGGLDLIESNAVKNALIALVNGIATIIFLFSEHVDWVIVAVVAGGSTVGALIGSRYGRLIPALWYRALIVAIGTTAGIWFIVS